MQEPVGRGAEQHPAQRRLAVAADDDHLGVLRIRQRHERLGRPLLHELAARDPNVAVRRLAIVCFKNGTPARETIVILDGIAADDETDPEVRKTAGSVSTLLVKKSRK